MTLIVTLIGYTPGARYDGRPWIQARIEEAADVNGAPGTWAPIDTITLTPVDTDPTDPQERDFTSTHATLTDAWYRVVFIDADGDEQYTDPVTRVGTLRPTVRDLGQRVFTRTLNTSGERLGTFTDATTPTDEQAEAVIDDAYGIVVASVGTDPPVGMRPLFRYAVIARAAMSIERTFYNNGEQTGDSTYQDWLAEYETAIAAITTGISQDEPNTPRIASVPMLSLAAGWPGSGLLDPFNTELLP